MNDLRFISHICQTMDSNDVDRTPLYEEDEDFVNEDDIHAFAKALVWDESDANHYCGHSTEGNVNGDMKDGEIEEIRNTENGIAVNEAMPLKRPDLISSKSDWFPLNRSHEQREGKKQKKQKKNKKGDKGKTDKRPDNEFKSSFSYTVLRWPLLALIFTWVLFLGLLYVVVRAYVALSEYFVTWVGVRKKLRNKLRASKNYEEWVENARALDSYLNLDKWSTNPKFSYYDYRTVEITISRLRGLRAAGNDLGLMLMLQGCLKKNFAGIENKQLYSHRYYGTKKLVEDYVEEVTQCINVVTDSNAIDIHEKRSFFKIVSKNYGKTALCLSGGASFAYTHFGIIKGLLDNDLLPSIISGTSGGGLVAALACTRTNEELKQLLVPELARKITPCEDSWRVWIPRWWKTGARFDSLMWARKANFFTRGSMTFKDAYKRTGRRLNISTVPADPHSPAILCNDITSPNCIIWSSLLASAAVPGILNPAVLMMRDLHNGQVVPFSLGNKWKDGSLRTDIPVDALNTYYNANFTIVSQVNPHISLFFFAPKGSVGRPVAMPRRQTSKEKYASLRGGFIATALEQLFRLEITKWLQLIKSLDLFPHFWEQDWSSIWLQRFSGTITIWPRNRLKDFYYILSDPSEQRFSEILKNGERAIFPKLLFIKHRLSIESAIERGKNVCREAQYKLEQTPSNGEGSMRNTKSPSFSDDGNHSVYYSDSSFDESYTASEESDIEGKRTYIPQDLVKSLFKFSVDFPKNSLRRRDTIS